MIDTTPLLKRASYQLDGAPLLTTKLTIPPLRPDLIARPQLIRRINQEHRKLTLISAPAGFGKTTLLSEWSAQSAMPVAWVTLDSSDNDPTRFWSYIISALDGQRHDIGHHALSLLRATPAPPIESILTILINEIMATHGDLAIVLDDYHAITLPAIQQSVAFLLEHLPPQLHLVISSRSDPPLPLARLRARRQLFELHDTDLRFAPDEAAALLNQTMRLGLDREQIDALETRTEGWATGLQLAALSLQDRTDRDEFIDTFTGSHHSIVDFLANEVFQQQPAHVQTFLLWTSILDRLNGPLCDALMRAAADHTGWLEPNGQDTLAQLEHDNLFLVPLDEGRQWYRYYHIFAEFLRARLAHEYADMLPELHRRASIWYERSGITTEAVNHALAADDFARAATLITKMARPMMFNGEVFTLLGWITRLPDEIIREQPPLGMLHALALLFAGKFDEAERRFQDIEHSSAGGLLSWEDDCAAEKLLDEQPADSRTLLQGELAALRALLASFRGDAISTIVWAQQAIEYLPQSGLPLRSMLAISKGSAYRLSGNLQQAEQAYEEAAVAGYSLGNGFSALPALYHLADLYMEQGRLHQAASTYQRALRLVADMGGDLSPLASSAHISLAQIMYEWNDLTAAEQHLRQGLRFESQITPNLLALGYIRRARVQQARGNYAEAHSLLQIAARRIQKQQIHTSTLQIIAEQASFAISRGDLDANPIWVLDRQLSTADEHIDQREYEYTMLARLRIAQGQPGDAIQLLERLQRSASASGRMGREIEILVVQALALQDIGQTTAALQALHRALALGEPEGYTRAFLDAGTQMAVLLTKLLASTSGSSADYTLKLLAEIGAAVDPSHALGDASAEQNLIEPLSERELTVLRLLASGASSRAIADDLVITPGTVKRHLHNIYGKLDASNRIQALERARELKLIPV